MKRLTVALIAFMCAFSFANAQLKPEGGSIGLGFHVTGLAGVSFSNWGSSGVSGGGILFDAAGFTDVVDNMVPQNMLFGRYYLSSDLALRVGLGINNMSTTVTTSDSTGSAITTTEDKMGAFSFGIMAGVEKHFATSAERLDPYAGAQLHFASLGAIKHDMTSNTNSDPAVSTSLSETWDGGSGFGFNLLGGFNYFFSDMVAIGAEVGWGFNTMSMGGDYNVSTTVDVGGTATTTTDTESYKASSGGLSVGATGGVNFSIFW